MFLKLRNLINNSKTLVLLAFMFVSFLLSLVLVFLSLDNDNLVNLPNNDEANQDNTSEVDRDPIPVIMSGRLLDLEQSGDYFRLQVDFGNNYISIIELSKGTNVISLDEEGNELSGIPLSIEVFDLEAQNLVGVRMDEKVLTQTKEVVFKDSTQLNEIISSRSPSDPIDLYYYPSL